MSPDRYSIVKAADNANEYACRNDVLAGYIRKGARQYQPVCDNDRDDNTHLAEYYSYTIPNQTEINVYMVGIYPPSYIVTETYDGYYANEVYRSGQWTKIDHYEPLGILTQALNNSYTICEWGYNAWAGLPVGYRFTGKTESTACYLEHTTTPQYNYKAWNIKAIGANSEYICKPLNNMLGQGRGQSIPSNYTLDSESYSAQCLDFGTDTNGDPKSNMWNLRRLNDRDTVCKSTMIPNDYGVVRETTLANCNGMNAYQIIKLSGTTTLCNSFNNFSVKLNKLGYVPVGQTHLNSCPGTGNNARIIRPVEEPIDTVCANLSYNKPVDYTIESYTTLPNCPNDRGATIKVQYMPD